MESILNSIKKALGIDEDCLHFDQELIMHINSALMVLNQLGVGPSIGLYIADKTTIWSQLLGDRIDIEAVKTLVYLRVKQIFDPPSSSFVIDAIDKQITQLEWRIQVQIEALE